MKILVVYDSMYGNTEKIARSIAGGLSGEIRVKKAVEASSADLQNIDLLVIGSPVQGGHPLKATQAFLDSLTGSSLNGLKAAAFDTRITGSFAKLFGWAAKRISDSLVKKGVRIIVEPEGFYVKGKQGPLLEGEMDRSAEWGRKVMEAARNKEPATVSQPKQ